MRQIFIIQGEPATGKSILGNIINNHLDAKVFDDFVVNDKNYRDFKRELLSGLAHLYYYIVIVTNCNDDDLNKLIKKLKEFDKPISVCKMSRSE